MPSTVRIYHNPQCSKSREALDYLKERGIEPEVVEYLKSPPTIEDLRSLVKMLGVAPSSIVRTSDFQRLELAPAHDAEGWLALIAAHPALLERPIVVVNDKARVARPIDQLFDFLP